MVANIPRVGMRMVKTALAVAICFFFMFCAERKAYRFFYDCRDYLYAALCGKQHTGFHKPYYRHTAGAVFALLVLYLIQYIPYQVRILRYLVISFAVIPVMYVTVLLKRTGASALAGIVLLSVCLSNVGYTPLEGNQSFC